MNRLLVGIVFSGVLFAGAFPSEVYPQIRETGSPAMVQQCRKNFEAMDTNGDGVVTKQEFMSFKHRRQNVEEVFKSRDANGDSVLSKDEFCAGKGGGRGKK